MATNFLLVLCLFSCNAQTSKNTSIGEETVIKANTDSSRLMARFVDEIYRQTFSDRSNFKITTLLEQKMPVRIFIIDTTNTWRTKRFWLDELEALFFKGIRKMEANEHHPYHHTYIFKDTLLDKLITDTEKKALSKRAGQLRSTHISFKGKNYSTFSSAKSRTGFYFATTQPVFSSDLKYAFIDLTVFYRDSLSQELNDTYFGTTCIVYEKQPDNKWRKIKVRNHLIL